MTYFSVKEMSCPCCNLYKADKTQEELMNKARYFAGVPIYVNSWTRCDRENEEAGGSITSSHLTGKATDMRLNKKKGQKMTSQERYILVTALLKAGFKRILIYETFIHADSDDNKPKEVIGIL